MTVHDVLIPFLIIFGIGILVCNRITNQKLRKQIDDILKKAGTRVIK